VPPNCSKDLGITPYNHQSGQEDEGNTRDDRVHLAAEKASVQVYADGLARVENKQIAVLPKRYTGQNPERQQTREDNHQCRVARGEDLFVTIWFYNTKVTVYCCKGHHLKREKC